MIITTVLELDFTRTYPFGGFAMSQRASNAPIFKGTNRRQLVVSLGQQWLQLPRTDSGGVCVECLVLELLGFARDSHVDVRSYVVLLVCTCVYIYNIHIQSHTHTHMYLYNSIYI